LRRQAGDRTIVVRALRLSPAAVKTRWLGALTVAAIVAVAAGVTVVVLGAAAIFLYRECGSTLARCR
jgi:hypothetical protein